MDMKLTFERLENSRWYVVLPKHKGNLEELAMVENAGKMLDALSTDGLYVTLDVNLKKPSSDGFFTLELESSDDKGAFYNVIDCPQFKGTIWLSDMMQTIFREFPSRIYCTTINSCDQQMEKNHNKQSHPQKPASEKPDTVALMYETLYNIGCLPTIDRYGIMSVQYRDVIFHMDFGGMYVSIWEFNWATAKKNDPNMPIVREAMNDANLNFGATIVMTEHNKAGKVAFCTHRDIMLHPACPDNETFVKEVLDSFFDAKEQMRRIFLQIKARDN